MSTFNSAPQDSEEALSIAEACALVLYVSANTKLKDDSATGLSCSDSEHLDGLLGEILTTCIEVRPLACMVFAGIMEMDSTILSFRSLTS